VGERKKEKGVVCILALDVVGGEKVLVDIRE
jgi:hypothetical protein